MDARQAHRIQQNDRALGELPHTTPVVIAAPDGQHDRTSPMLSEVPIEALPEPAEIIGLGERPITQGVAMLGTVGDRYIQSISLHFLG